MQFKWQLTFNIVKSFMNFLGFLGHTFIRMLVLALMDLLYLDKTASFGVLFINLSIFQVKPLYDNANIWDKLFKNEPVKFVEHSL